MFKDVEELKNFIIWAKSQKIKRIKVKTVEVEISDYAFIEDLVTPQSQSTLSTDEPPTPDELEKIKAEEDELLMWSAKL